jgi:hypothetical protein
MLDRLKTRGTSQAMIRSVLGDEILQELGYAWTFSDGLPVTLANNYSPRCYSNAGQWASSLALTRQPFF